MDVWRTGRPTQRLFPPVGHFFSGAAYS